MKKIAVAILLVFMLGAGLLYAGTGNLIVNGLLGVGQGFNNSNLPAHAVDVQGDVNVYPGPLWSAAIRW